MILALFGMDDFAFYVIMTGVLNTALAYLLRPKIDDPKAATEAEFQFPTAEEGRVLPVVFGERRCAGPNVLWYGDLYVYKKKKSGGLFSSDTIVAYYYYMGIHFGICHGGVDGITQIWVSDKCVWPTLDAPTTKAADGETSATIAANECFGGYKRGTGGIAGTVDFQYGASDQTLNSYLEAELGSTIPNFRGMTAAVARQVYIGTSPNPYPWSFLVKRTLHLTDGSAQWYVAKADINGDLNPAHIIRECLTSTIIGLGMDASAIDATSFEAAADTLYGESFGLSCLLDHLTPEGIKDFIGDVLAAIDGVLYQDMSTGTFKLELARGDYTPASLDVYDEDDIVSLEEFSRPSYGEIASQVVVWWHDKIYNQDRPATDDDIAILDKQGGNPVVVEFRYTGICNETLANTIAAREMQQTGSMLASIRLTGKRVMAGLHPNSVFKLSYSELGIVEMIVRVVQINYGNLHNGEVTVTCVEDVFGTPYTTYANPPSSGWTPPTASEDDRPLIVGAIEAAGTVSSIESGPY